MANGSLHLLDPEPGEQSGRVGRRQGPGRLRPITFTLADTTAPTITGTTVSGRTVTITFSKALDPAPSRCKHLRSPPRERAAWPPTRPRLCRTISISTATPRTTISYNPATFTVDAQLQRPAPDRDADRPIRDRGLEPNEPDQSGRHRPGRQSARRLLHRQLPDRQRRDGAARLHPEPRPAKPLAPPIITTFEMTPTAANDTGIVGDQNTNISAADLHRSGLRAFPGTVAEPAGLHRIRRAARRQHHARRRRQAAAASRARTTRS